MSSAHLQSLDPSPQLIDNEKLRTPGAFPIRSKVTDTHSTKKKKMQLWFTINSGNVNYNIQTLVLYNIHKALGGAVDSVCDQFPNEVVSEFVPGSAIGWAQNEYGVTWRGSYMSEFTGANVNNVLRSIPALSRKKKVPAEVDEDGSSKLIWEDNTFVGSSNAVLDGTFVKNANVQRNNTAALEKTTDRAFKRMVLFRRNKQNRIGKRKREYEARKRRKMEATVKKVRHRNAVTMANLAAKTRLANAALTSTALRKLQSKQKIHFSHGEGQPFFWVSTRYTITFCPSIGQFDFGRWEWRRDQRKHGKCRRKCHTGGRVGWR